MNHPTSEGQAIITPEKARNKVTTILYVGNLTSFYCLVKVAEYQPTQV